MLEQSHSTNLWHRLITIDTWGYTLPKKKNNTNTPYDLIRLDAAFGLLRPRMAVNIPLFLARYLHFNWFFVVSIALNRGYDGLSSGCYGYSSGYSIRWQLFIVDNLWKSTTIKVIFGDPIETFEFPSTRGTFFFSYAVYAAPPVYSPNILMIFSNCLHSR